MQRNLSKREIGNIGEQATADFLVANGYNILERNYTIRGGEIDIIAEKNGAIAFVEVKTRSENALDDGVGAINYYKKQHIIKTAEFYIYKTRKQCNCRFDVAIVELRQNKVKHVRYYVSAFDASK